MQYEIISRLESTWLYSSVDINNSEPKEVFTVTGNPNRLFSRKRKRETVLILLLQVLCMK